MYFVLQYWYTACFGVGLGELAFCTDFHIFKYVDGITDTIFLSKISISQFTGTINLQLVLVINYFHQSASNGTSHGACNSCESADCISGRYNCLHRNCIVWGRKAIR